jgi:hypothetical protein
VDISSTASISQPFQKINHPFSLSKTQSLVHRMTRLIVQQRIRSQFSAIHFFGQLLNASHELPRYALAPTCWLDVEAFKKGHGR